MCGEESFEVARVEAGLPKFGAELDESVLPPEAGLDAGVVSYTKGCYIGQEVLNRIRTVGRVNRCLAGLRFSALLAGQRGFVALRASFLAHPSFPCPLPSFDQCA